MKFNRLTCCRLVSCKLLNFMLDQYNYYLTNFVRCYEGHCGTLEKPLVFLRCLKSPQGILSELKITIVIKTFLFVSCY